MEWVNVKDRLPEKGDYIIVYGKMDNFLCVLTTLTYENSLSPAITHWTLLNQPERSKREDCKEKPKRSRPIKAVPDHYYDSLEMRCSEHGSNVVRDK